MTQFLEQLRETLSKLSAGQKITIGVSLVLFIAFFVGMIIWLNSETYTPIFTSNDPAKVKEATKALDEAGIPYEVSDDGTKILTSEMDVGKARIISASTGIITGMEVLGGIEMGSSPQKERWIYNNAQAGELTKTINGLDEVEASRVHIVSSSDSPFLNRENESSASVIVKLKGGQSLSALQIKGITQLVAGAVKGLNANQVRLTDSSGRLLAGPSEDGDGVGVSGTSLSEIKQNSENQYRRKINAILEGILGSRMHFETAVTLTISGESEEVQENAVDPTTQVTLSETINESTSTKSNARGNPGTPANLPPGQNANQENGSSNEALKSATNYDFTRTTTRKVKSPGEVKSKSVAVSINSTALEELASSSNGQVSIEDLKKDIDIAVKAAIEYKEGVDNAKVIYVPFMALDSSELSDAGSGTNWLAVLPFGIALLAIVMFFLFVVRPLMNSLTSAISVSPEQRRLEDMTPEQREALEEGMGDARTDARLKKMVGNFKEADKKELNQLIHDKGEPSAEVLRRWIKAQ